MVIAFIYVNMNDRGNMHTNLKPANIQYNKNRDKSSNLKCEGWQARGGKETVEKIITLRPRWESKRALEPEPFLGVHICNARKYDHRGADPHKPDERFLFLSGH